MRRARETGSRQARLLHPLTQKLGSTTNTASRFGARGLSEGHDLNVDEKIGAGKPRHSQVVDARTENELVDLISTSARGAPPSALADLSAVATSSDPELGELVTQLRSHLGSMQSNVAGLRGVKRELGMAEAVLERFGQL